MDFFNSRVTELLFEFVGEVVPVGVLVSGSIWILVVIAPVDLAMVGPPVLGMFGEVRGGEDHYKRGDSSELMSKHLEIGVTIPKESVHVIMVPLKWLQGSHEDQLDS